MKTTEKETASPGLLTAGGLLALRSRGVRGELVRGVLCETMATGHQHGKIAANLVFELLAFVKPRGLGTVVASDAGFWLERDPDTVREPDVAFTSARKIPLEATIVGYAEVAPDLVAEIVSPGDSRRWAAERARMWLGHGVRLVWLVHPRTRTVDIYRPGVAAVLTLGEDDRLNGLDVLEGFSCAVSAVLGP